MTSSIYLFDRLDTFHSKDLEKMLPIVSEQRRERVLFFKSELDRKLSMVTYLLLKFGLKELYGITENPVFTFGRYGKPILQDHPEIHFNFSHCREAAACAISSEEVGIDIESIEPYDAMVAHHVFNECEVDAIEQSGHAEFEFTRLWTVKESFLKRSGKGIRDDLKNLLNAKGQYHFYSRISPEQKYVVTICQNDTFSPSFRKVEISQL